MRQRDFGRFATWLRALGFDARHPVLIALIVTSGCVTAPLVRTPSPLHLAAAERDTSKTIQLLNVIDPNVRFSPYDPSKVDWRTESTPLHWAATHGAMSLIEPLVMAGARVNARGTIGWTPLHCAAYAGHPLTCERLVRFGSRMGAQTPSGITPMHLAAWAGHPETLTRLTALGGDPNTTTDSGETPLHVAAAAGHPKTVRRLLDLGADPDATTRTGEKAVDLARLYRHRKTAEVLSGG